MRRFVVLVAMLVPLSLFAAGCGGGGADSTSSKKTEAEKKMMMEGAMKGGMKEGGMMSKEGKGAGVPDKTPTPEKK